MSEGLFNKLNTYSDSETYPFHMPGHKRNPESGALADWNHFDITEIDGFDNLHQPEGIIHDAQLRAAQLYGSEESYYLINGSTSGILSAIAALKGNANKLIIARNCHKAVYHAAFLNKMELRYIYPELLHDYEIAGQIVIRSVKEEIERILKEEKLSPQEASRAIAGVVITSPTYEGIVSDVREIAELVHSYGLALIVDQAHGAHFGLHRAFPENAVKQGADVVIHSVHKTLAAPTQTALIHRNGNLVSQDQLRKYLTIYQSSSPSYVLMAGIDESINIAKEEGKERLDRMLAMRLALTKELASCQHIAICSDTEPGKLVISIKDSTMTGQQLYHILREKYKLQMEMAAGSYVVAILTMMDTQEGFDRLTNALLEIDTDLKTLESEADTIGEIGIKANTDAKGRTPEWMLRPEVSMPLWKAYSIPFKVIELEGAQDRIAADFINLYPPGIPIVVPGEKVDSTAIRIIQSYLGKGYVVQGVEHNKIRVVSPLV